MFFSPKRDGSSNQSKLWLNKCCPHHDIQVWNNCKSQTPNKHYWHYCSSNFSSSWIALSDPVSSFCCEADASLWMSGGNGLCLLDGGPWQWKEIFRNAKSQLRAVLQKLCANTTSFKISNNHIKYFIGSREVLKAPIHMLLNTKNHCKPTSW